MWALTPCPHKRRLTGTAETGDYDVEESLVKTKGASDGHEPPRCRCGGPALDEQIGKKHPQITCIWANTGLAGAAAQESLNAMRVLRAAAADAHMDNSDDAC